MLAAAVVFFAGYAWRLQVKVNTLKAKIELLSPMQSPDGLNFLIPQDRDKVARINFTFRSLRDDPELPEKLKRSLEWLRADILADPTNSHTAGTPHTGASTDRP